MAPDSRLLRVASGVVFLVSFLGFWGLTWLHFYRLTHAGVTFDDYLGFTLVGSAVTAIASGVVMVRSMNPQP